MNIAQYWWTVRTLKIAYQVKLRTDFPASAMCAQAIHESYYGDKVPVDLDTGKVSNNILGIKCTIKDGIIIEAGDNGWVKDLTREWNVKEQVYELDIAYFRAYRDYSSCFQDYVNLIKNAGRYKKALDRLSNPKEYIYELYKAGYATDPDYFEKILKLINQVNRIPVVLLKLV